MENKSEFTEFPKYLKIQIRGGIGDCIKILTCNYPLTSLNEKYGTQIFVSYEGFGASPQGQNQPICKEKLERLKTTECPWKNVLRENIFEKCPFLIPVSSESFNSLDCPTVHSWFKDFESQIKGKFQHFLPLELNTKPPFPVAKSYRNIAIQLSSNEKCKVWSNENWNLLIKKILEKYKYSRIYLIDDPKKRKLIDQDFKPDQKKLFNTATYSLAESISLISEMDLIICSDSFSKYIALCNSIPAIILCADVGFMSPSDLLKGCFLSDIVYNDKYKLLGADIEENFKVNSMVKNVNDITVEDVFENV
tara:strand:+ start:185 stop:1105 length:921 start_codon:yes stop_codon:yes gene_type:complete